MKILALESSAVAASVALIEDEKILVENYCNIGFTHSQTLMPMVQNLLSISNHSMHEIDGFAVSAGPGSFTGIRIGVSAVKGLAFGTEKPCVPVSTLEGIAEPFRGQDVTVCAVMDARCKQFYQAFFSCKGGRIDRLTEDRAVSSEQLTREIETMPDPVILAGDGAYLANQLLKNNKCRLAPTQLLFQRASSVALIGARRFKEGCFVHAEQLVPFYLRPPQAERELAKKKKG